MMRQSTGEVGDFDVEKGTPHLQGIHHARAVGFGEDAVLQINLGVELKGSIHGILNGAGFPSLDGLAVDFFNAEARIGQAGEFRWLKGTQPDRIPKARGMILPAQGAFDFEIEADIGVGNRQAGRQKAQGFVQRPGDHF